jgi:RNA polymerase sigma factor (sigma-70 family)
VVKVRKSKAQWNRAVDMDAGTNWDMEAAMHDHGIANPVQLEAAGKARGLKLSGEDAKALFAGRMTARAVDGSWHPAAVAVGEVLNCSLEALFDIEHQWAPVDRFDVADTSLAAETEFWGRESGSMDPNEIITDKEVSHFVAVLLRKVTPREERVLRLFYGIGCPSMTMFEIGQKFRVTQERIKQILDRVMSKLKRRSKYGYKYSDAKPSFSDMNAVLTVMPKAKGKDSKARP